MRFLFFILAVVFCFCSYAQQKDNALDSVQTSVSNTAEEQELLFKKVNHQIDSLQQNFQSKLDSLKQLLRQAQQHPQPDTALINRLTALKSKTDSLKNSLAALPDGSEEISKIQNAFDKALGKVQNPVNEKISLFQQNGAEGISPLEIPELPGGLPKVYDNFNPPLGNINLPETDLSDLPLPDIKQPSLGEVHVPPSPLERGPEGEVALEKLEDEISKLDQLDGLQEELAQADKLKRYYDPQVAKEEVLNKAKEEAVNHFAGHEEELKAAMEKLSALKAKFPHPEGTLDLFAKRQRFLKDRPFIERVIPGFTFQFQKSNSFWLDLNPQLGFKISPRLVSGIGWNERLCYDFDNPSWDTKNHIYGIRSFIHFKLKENIFLKADIESMNAPVRATQLLTSEIIGRSWIWSYFGGVKRDFQLGKNMKGNVQMLYNIYNPEKRSPYSNRFNVRLGLEVPRIKATKKKSRPDTSVN